MSWLPGTQSADPASTSHRRTRMYGDFYVEHVTRRVVYGTAEAIAATQGGT
jgi:hypothetical protein